MGCVSHLSHSFDGFLIYLGKFQTDYFNQTAKISPSKSDHVTALLITLRGYLAAQGDYLDTELPRHRSPPHGLKEDLSGSTGPSLTFPAANLQPLIPTNT